MSSNKELIAKDLFPRALGIALIVLMVWIVTSYMNKSDEDEWKRTLVDANERAIESFSGTLKRRLESVASLSRDRRLEPLFDPSYNIGDNTPKAARRALYEFKYINEIDHAYIFSSVLGELVLTSAGSPPLPAGNLSPYYTAAQEKLEELTNIATIGGQTYMLFGHAIYGETGRILGYAIYADTLKMFYRDASTPLRGIQNIEFSSYLIGNGNALSVPNYTKKVNSVRIIPQSKTPFPIFDGNFTSKKFTLPTGETVLANGEFVIEIPKWRIISSVDMKFVNSDSDHKRIILIGTMIFGIIVILLIPISGPYSDMLRKVYAKIGLIKAVPLSIDEDDLNRMRLDPPPSLGGIDKKKLELNQKINQERAKPKDDYKPSDAVIAYNIRTGIKNRRMKLLYQPIFDAKSNEVNTYEVYLRIIDDEGKVMPPSLWLPVARAENLFSLIDETVVSIAVDKFFMRDDPLRISLAFNISGNTFGSLEFLQKLMNSSTNNYPIADHTIFELRSKEIIEDKRAMSFIKECREMGFRFSIDYFGGGVQTIKAAKTLKFDYIKIDVLKFDLGKAEGQKEFIRLIKTAQAINLPVVIEKIEDEKTLRFCKKIGANFVQGYHLAEPNVDLLKS
jgi:EAL domain-containing protein (putative c-di-GMP-specific phosphodiesterase class I)